MEILEGEEEKPLGLPPFGLERYLPEYAWTIVGGMGKDELTNRIAQATQGLRRAAQTVEQWEGVVALTEQVYAAQEALQRQGAASGEVVTVYRDFSDAPAKAKLYESEEIEIQRALTLLGLITLYVHAKSKDEENG